MTHLVEPCDICGDIGFEEDIVTCCQCNIAQEHCYCMRKVRLMVPDIWICEECQLSNSIPSKSVTAEHVPMALTSNASDIESPSWFLKNTSGECHHASTLTGFETMSHSSLHGNQENAGLDSTEMDAKVGKVEFISTEEDIAVLSCTHKLKHSPMNTGSGLGLSATTMPKKSPTGFNDALLACSLKKVKSEQDRNIGYSRCGCCSSGFSSTIQQNVFQTSREFQDDKTNACKNKQQIALMPIERVENSNLLVEKTAKFTDSHSADALPIVCSVKPESMVIVESNPLSLESSLVKSFPNYPTPESTWCGSFEIVNSVSHSEFYDGFCAHPPVKVCRKALEFSKKMPGVLLCSLIPISDVWMDLFPDECPNMEDVALYFFPGSLESCKQKYIRLFGYMEAHSLVLRSCINGVELLIFSSTRLHVKLCDLRWNFLWGVYRRSRKSMAFPLLPFNDMKTQECTQNLDVKTTSVNKHLTKVKTKQFDSLEDIPRMCKNAGDDAA